MSKLRGGKPKKDRKKFPLSGSKKRTTPAPKPKTTPKVHHRSSPGPDPRKPWQRGGFKSKAAYDAAVKKDPRIKGWLE